MTSFTLSEFSGISRTEADLLIASGIQSNVDFFCTGAGHIYQKTKEKMPFKRLQEIEKIVGLTTLTSVNPNIACDLFKGGITSVKELQNLSLQGLREKIKTTDEALCVRILKEATLGAHSTIAFGQVCGVRQTPLANATIRIDDKTVTTNSNGFFIITSLSAWQTKMEVEYPGYLKLWTTFQPKTMKQKTNVTLKLSGTDTKSSLFFDEWKGGTFQRTSSDITKYKDVEVTDLPENTPLSLYSVGRYQDGQVRLVSLFKVKEGRDVFLFRLKVPSTKLSKVKEGMVYFVKGGQIVGGEKTKKEFWKEFATSRLHIPSKFIEKMG